MRRSAMALVFSLCTLVSGAFAQETTISLEGEVPEGEETHFFLPFEVPAGIREIEIRHDDLSGANILDWGLDDPNGFRGWGGGNTEPAIVGIDAASRSYVPGTIPQGTWEVVVGKAKVVELPARYSVEVILREEPTLPAQTERRPYHAPPALEVGARWYAGDFHVHSRESGDADPTIEEILAFASGCGLDFVLLSEHNTNSQLTYYDAPQQVYPNVLLLPGAEFTTYGGHANVIGTTEWIDHRIGVRGATIEAAIQSAHDQGGLFSINHPDIHIGNACIGCGWDHPVDPTQIDGVEVQSAYIPGLSFWENLVAQGSHAAALGGSDDHRGGDSDYPIGRPTTLVYADELSVEGILAGIRNGRTVVKVDGPDGPMIEVELDGERRGSVVSAMQSTLHATVTGADGLTLRLIKNGETLGDLTIDGDPFVHDVPVEAPVTGQDRYRYMVVSGQSVKTITSYVWLQAAQSDIPGDGCAVTPLASCRLSWVPLIGLAVLVWARRRAPS